MHVRMLKRKLKNRPRKLRPVRRCFLSTFTLITCRSFIILNFIYARKANQIQVLECLPLFLSLSSFLSFIIIRTKNLYGKKTIKAMALAYCVCMYRLALPINSK